MSIPTQKDADQTLRYAFDDASDSFRVLGTFTASSTSNGNPGAPPPAQATYVAGQNTSNGNLQPLQTDAAGSLLVDIASTEGPLAVNIETNQVILFSVPYDAITVTYPLTTQEVYQSRIGGVSGVVQQTVTVNYVDATKNQLLNVART